jgi:hypothetical protein
MASLNCLARHRLLSKVQTLHVWDGPADRQGLMRLIDMLVA